MVKRLGLDIQACFPYTFIITRTRCATTSSTSYEIGDLEPGREYAFAVVAFNEVGESDPLSTVKTIIAKDQFCTYCKWYFNISTDEVIFCLPILACPLAPGSPNVVDWSERHMSLVWKLPIDDGGQPITGYHVEAKTNNDDEWYLCEVIDTNTLKVGSEHKRHSLLSN